MVESVLSMVKIWTRRRKNRINIVYNFYESLIFINYIKLEPLYEYVISLKVLIELYRTFELF